MARSEKEKIVVVRSAFSKAMRVGRAGARDAQASATVRTVLEPRIKHQERMRDALATSWEQTDEQRRNRLLYGALWMGLEFQTWHTLVRQQGFEDDEIIEMMMGMVRCLVRD